MGVVIVETKANLAQFQMKLPAGAKLGNIIFNTWSTLTPRSFRIDLKKHMKLPYE